MFLQFLLYNIHMECCNIRSRGRLCVDQRITRNTSSLYKLYRPNPFPVSLDSAVYPMVILIHVRLPRNHYFFNETKQSVINSGRFS